MLIKGTKYSQIQYDEFYFAFLFSIFHFTCSNTVEVEFGQEESSMWEHDKIKGWKIPLKSSEGIYLLLEAYILSIVLLPSGYPEYIWILQRQENHWLWEKIFLPLPRQIFIKFLIIWNLTYFTLCLQNLFCHWKYVEQVSLPLTCSRWFCVAEMK